MNQISFFIDGEPVAKGRPRVCKNGITFTPKKTSDHEKCFFLGAEAAVNINGWKKLSRDKPVSVKMFFVFSMPKSWSKKKREQMNQSACTKRPDIDNLVKMIDGINGAGVWEDDSQVTAIEAEKVWGEHAFTQVIITEL